MQAWQNFRFLELFKTDGTAQLLINFLRLSTGHVKSEKFNSNWIPHLFSSWLNICNKNIFEGIISDVWLILISTVKSSPKLTSPPQKYNSILVYFVKYSPSFSFVLRHLKYLLIRWIINNIHNTLGHRLWSSKQHCFTAYFDEYKHPVEHLFEFLKILLYREKTCLLFWFLVPWTLLNRSSVSSFSELNLAYATDKTSLVRKRGFGKRGY